MKSLRGSPRTLDGWQQHAMQQCAMWIVATAAAACGGGAGDTTGTDPTSTPGIVVSVSPSNVSLVQGAGGAATITVSRRGGFAGAVSLAITGLPTGVTVTPNPASIPGGSTTSTLDFSAAANAVAGNYQVTVTGSGTGVENQATTLAVTVTTAPSTSASWQYCPSDSVLWFAVQDGIGAWTRVTPVNNRFTFNVSAAKGGIAYVQAVGSNVFLYVLYGMKQELSDAGVDLCPYPTRKTVNGSVAGLAPGEDSYVSLGFITKRVTANGNFVLDKVPTDNSDLIASKTLTVPAGGRSTVTVSKLIVRRNQNPESNSTMPVLDFGAAEAFDPIQKNLTINDIGSDIPNIFSAYTTTNNLLAELYFVGSAPSSSSQTYFGVPAARQATGDVHLLQVSAPNSSGGTLNYIRTAGTFFRDAGDKTIALGPVPPPAIVASLAVSPYARLRMQWTAQPGYNAFFTAEFSQVAAARFAIVAATSGYLGGPSVDLSIPDFAGAAGWDSSWGLKAGALTFADAGGWSFVGANFSTIPTPTDGGAYRQQYRELRITP